MKVLLINLDRATDRLERMRRVFGEAGIEFERVSGVAAGCLRKNLSVASRSQVISAGWRRASWAAF